MRNDLDLLPEAGTTAELMGVEGAAARNYFGVLGARCPEELKFSGRSRRPALNVVNAALGYGYAMLLGECVSALVAAGLDPAIGMLHEDADLVDPVWVWT